MRLWVTRILMDTLFSTCNFVLPISRFVCVLMSCPVHTCIGRSLQACLAGELNSHLQACRLCGKNSGDLTHINHRRCRVHIPDNVPVLIKCESCYTRTDSRPYLNVLSVHNASTDPHHLSIHPPNLHLRARINHRKSPIIP